MAEDHGSPEAGKLPRVWTRGRRETENHQRASIQCQRSKENSSKGKKKRRVFLCRRTVTVKVKSKVIPTSFLKIEGRKTFVGAKDQRKRDG